MLFRLVRPVLRPGSRNRYFNRRIPADVSRRAVGLKFSLRVGDELRVVTITPSTRTVRLSLGTGDPAEVKARLASVDAQLEKIWQGLRNAETVTLTQRQAVALSARLYHGWANGEGRERTTAVEFLPAELIKQDLKDKGLTDSEIAAMRVTGKWRAASPHLDAVEWKSAAKFADRISDKLPELERTFGAITDRLLLQEGIASVDLESRRLILIEFARAFRDAMQRRRRNAKSDYSPDPKAERFPEWAAPQRLAKTNSPSLSPPAKVSLKALVEMWWVEAKAMGRKPSTYQSYNNTMTKFVACIGHDNASRVTPEDVIRFKDARLKAGVSPKTIKDSDLAGLKTVFEWATVNRKMATNPAEGITLKIGKSKKLRSKGFDDGEALAILRHASHYKAKGENAKLAHAKRWLPWLCAFTGARVGEMLQLRKEDLRRDGEHWVIRVTPDAGTVKTNEARDIVLHPQLLALGFPEFVEKAGTGHIFVTPRTGDGDVLDAIKSARNKLGDFVREVVSDRNVNPNHGWRHRFKTVGREAGIDSGILDAIQGHKPRNVADSYGDVTIRTMAAAIGKLPWYEIKM